jgi:UTRA domain-containing protein
MMAGRGDGVRRAGARRSLVSAGVLADRMAAALVHHEPGWRLPRLTALARRYNVSAAEIDTAIDELAARHLLRRLPDGQVYRASPAEYFVPLEGLSGLTSHVDPMGGQLACKSRQVSRRRAPEDIGRSLGLEPSEAVLAIRCLWTVGGEPGALSTTYLPERPGDGLPEVETPPFVQMADAPLGGGSPTGAPAVGGQGTVVGSGSPANGPCATEAPPPPAGPGHARALQIEMAPPPPSVARSLRLVASELVATVTVAFEDPAAHSPVALTIAMLRPDLFRIVVQATTEDVPAGDLDRFPTAWTHAAAGWEP